LLIQPIVFAKATFQPRFLDERNVNQIQDHEQDAPVEQMERLEKRSLSQKYAEYTADHRIANMAINASNDQLLSGIPRC
jgi:hypothetical protein